MQDEPVLGHDEYMSQHAWTILGEPLTSGRIEPPHMTRQEIEETETPLGVFLWGRSGKPVAKDGKGGLKK